MGLFGNSNKLKLPPPPAEDELSTMEDDEGFEVMEAKEKANIVKLFSKKSNDPFVVKPTVPREDHEKASPVDIEKPLSTASTDEDEASHGEGALASTGNRERAVAPQEGEDAKRNKRKGMALCMLAVLAVLAIILGATLGRQDADDNLPIVAGSLGTTSTAEESAVDITSVPSVQLEINFDDFASHISWEIEERPSRTMVAQVAPGTYADTETTFSQKFDLAYDVKYIFRIFDSEGDGLCCENAGNYTLSYAGNVLASGSGDFGARMKTSFIIHAAATEGSEVVEDGEE